IASSTAQKNSFELLVHIMTGGKAGMYLSNLKINDLVQFQGPAGIFTLRESERDKVFLSTGCGIAPIRSILKSIIYHPSTRYFLFWGFSTFKDVYIYDELKRIKAQNPNFNFTICLSRETNLDMIPVEDRKHFMLGHITDGFNKFLELPLQGEQVTSYKLQESDFYLCSRREVIDSLKIYLASIGALKEQVYFEKF
ncbi:MAG: FAD-binding oxidoreductase, partial [bacterium]|nr:FAD-binding oxidoreductase [bacterium]